MTTTKFDLFATAAEYQAAIDQHKPNLEAAETEYALAIAANDLEAIAELRKTIGRYRKIIGQLVKAKLAVGRGTF